MDDKNHPLTAIPHVPAAPAGDEDTTKPTAVKAATGSGDGNQGEGDRVSARKYDADVRSFVSSGKVQPAAEQARAFVQADPAGAAKAEAEAKAGPHGHHLVEDIVAKGREVIDKVVDKVRHTIKK